MLNSDVTIVVAILALLRGDLSVRCIADRFGVTEALVCEWRDVFIVAGSFAVKEHGESAGRRRRLSALGDIQNATTFSPDGGIIGATTTPEPTPNPIRPTTMMPAPTTTPSPTTAPVEPGEETLGTQSS